MEYGGADGKLCNDILDYFFTNHPDYYQRIEYYLIDVVIKQPEKWKHEKVKWLSNASTLKQIHGCVISNELHDNLPVNSVVMKNQLMEVFVDLDHNEFVEVLLPAEERPQNYFEQLAVSLPYDFKTEINLDSLQWISEVSNLLDKGFIITIDYGFHSDELYNKNRKDGTVVCYHQHKKHFNPYRFAGQQDITSHVNFSALNYWGQKAGLNLTGYTTQHYFLRSLGLCSCLPSRKEQMSELKSKKIDLFNHFFGEFSSQVKVLIQHKEMPRVNLQGLLFHFSQLLQCNIAKSADFAG